MDIKKVRVHTCNPKIEGYIVEKCRCRKFVSLQKASALIDDGAAQNVITSFRMIEVKGICPVCGGIENFKKRCQFCKNTGVVSKKKVHIDIGEDIYMRPFLKTPRTATIEEEHIEYAYIKNDHDAQRRIEQYHGMNQAALAELGAALIDTKTGEVLIEGTPEPDNSPKKWQGRDSDWGRPI